MRKRSKTLFFFLLFFVPLFAKAQQGNNWYFGTNAGITFNTTPPTALMGSSMRADEASSSISDNAGNLLFYTDGMTVYNRLHTAMPNGNGLMGHLSTTTVLVAPKPGNSNIYYIFHSDNFTNPGSGNRYSEVDMTLDGGLGDITANKNILIGTPPVTERVAAVRHANGKDIWIVTKEYHNNRFNSYLLTCNGVDPNAVVSDVGIVHTDPGVTSYTAQGQMKISPDGKKLGVVINRLNIFQLFDFSTTTGQISNPIDINVFPVILAGIYGCEFSPNSQVLYVSQRTTNRIYQFDISSNNQVAINASSVIIPVPNPAYALQLGPDQKIYAANNSWPFISVFNNPDSYGSGFGYTPQAISLAGNICEFGLPAYITNYYSPSNWITNFTYSFVDCHVQFSGTSTMPGPLQWQWDFDDGTTASGQVVNHSFPAAGIYNVKMTVYSLTTCNTLADSMTVTHPVTVSNVFSVDFNQTGACVNTAYQFNENIVLTVGAITGYSWDFGDGGTSAAANPSHVFTTAGSFPVKLVVSTSGICRADSITKTVYVDTKPLASFRANNGCVSQSISFTDQSTNTTGMINQWNWDFGGTGTSTTQNPSHTFISPGNYLVRLTVSSEHGCADDSIQNIIIEDKPAARFTQDLICFNKQVNFSSATSTISFGTINNWQWNFGDGGTSVLANPTHTYTSEGDFPVSLIVTSQYGCVSNPATFTAIVRKINVNAGSDTIAVYNQPVQLQGSGGVGYQWMPPFLLNNPTIANPIATLTNDQLFIMTATDALGCSGTDDVKITVVKTFDIYVPTGFTPNSDGKNDVLMPYPVGIKQLEYFNVYNRWGQLIFTTKQIGLGWDGRVAGFLQDAGIFVWMVKATDIKGRMIEKKGTSMLIR